MAERPYEGVVVLGAPRSGTTLLRRLLSAHPELHSPPETYLLTGAARFLRSDRFADGLAAGAVPGLIFSGYDEADVYERVREFAFGFLREIAEKAGKPVWVEKTGVNPYHIDQIEPLCGDRVRYVCIQRHGLDVACSMEELSSKMRAHLAELREHVRGHAFPLVGYAHAWVEANENILGLIERKPELCVSFRYEDLVDDPAPVLSKIFDFLGLDADAEELIAKAFGSDPGVGLGDWKAPVATGIERDRVDRAASLDDVTRTNVARVINPMLGRLGYDAVAETDAGSLTDACNRYGIQQMMRRMQAAKEKASRGGGA